jgi:hypothetical protein
MTIKSNPRYSISEAQIQKIDELTKKRRAIDEKHRVLVKPSKQAIETERRLNTKLMQALDLDITEISNIINESNAEERERFIVNLTSLPVEFWLPVISAPHHVGPAPKEPPPPPDNTIWWLRTDPYPWPGSRGIQMEWGPDGELHFFGKDNVGNSDDRVTFSVGATANFAMTPSRLISSTTGRWRSEPTITIDGNAYAYTGLQWWMSGGDKWSKCFLVLRQTVFQIPPSGYVRLGERISRTAILNEENQNRWQTAQMPGTVEMPRVDFSLADPASELHAELDIRFDIEVEGLAAMVLGACTNDSPVVLRTYQWTPMPA